MSNGTYRSLKALGVALILGAAVAVAPSPALAGHVSCGDTITKDTKLHNDLTNCPNNGIVIGADRITLDLNGHTIDGDGAPVSECPDQASCDVGVANTAGHNETTIKGGSVRQFALGVFVLGASRNRVGRLSGSDNSDFGVLLGESADCRIEKSSFANNGTSGIVLFDSHGNRIERNSAARNGHASVFLIGSDGNHIQRNLLDRNGDGIEVHESSSNQIRKNSISHSNGAAIDLSDGAGDNRVELNLISDNGDGVTSFEGHDNVISRNTVTGTGFFGDPEAGGFGIIFDGADDSTVERNLVVGGRGEAIFVTSLDSQDTSDRNVVSRNAVNSKRSDGILVNANATATLLERNTANRSGDDGIDVDAAGTTVSRNTANRNHDLGIEAVPGVIDGGGNKGTGNGNPLQCTNVFCK